MASLTFFESASLLAYDLQPARIGGGLWMMHRADVRRDRQLDALLEQSEAQTRSLDTTVAQGQVQTQALEKLLQRTG